jgi:N-hydroxyarylamine O-acetyltransferase
VRIWIVIASDMGLSPARRNRRWEDRVDLDAYLGRIGLPGPPPPTLAGLVALQRAHRRSIPFENLDIPLGRGISLDPGAVFAKLVGARRGGYCFEQNALFLAALGALGFVARPLLARVWLDATEVPPRTHALSLVTVDGLEWTADAGFGGSDVPPMRLVDGAETVVEGVHHRLTQDPNHGWMLTRNGQPQYSFTLERVHPVDLAMANHWVATMPGSRFVTQRIATLLGEGGLVSLNGTRLSHGGGATDVTDAVAYRAVLADRFGIVVSAKEAARLFAG